MLRAILLTVAAAAAAASANASVAISSDLKSLTADKVYSKILVKDDDLEFVATLSTEKAHRGSVGWHWTGNVVDSDPSLRAVIDRATGKIRYEVHHRVRYIGPERTFEAVHFQTVGGLARAAPTLNENGGDYCANPELSTDCILSKMIAFPIDESLLREIAARYDTDAGRPFAFRLKERAGRDVTALIMPAEAAGLLRKTGSYALAAQ
jgi:hypothetical protein